MVSFKNLWSTKFQLQLNEVLVPLHLAASVVVDRCLLDTVAFLMTDHNKPLIKQRNDTCMPGVICSQTKYNLIFLIVTDLLHDLNRLFIIIHSRCFNRRLTKNNKTYSTNNYQLLK